ncbi:hypothetical protein BDV96DRAFT_639196 [Lophiotrema nucula]|uniref:BTB domain-containing protein n=1 Tax=Lophiotrema nucula TaxID=690887 RepID=A0A6A5ZSZ3_9PLEO|nr:hypothetical protein BDV96DRAFT_639196 [Lophiotrema nucula]
MEGIETDQANEPPAFKGPSFSFSNFARASSTPPVTPLTPATSTRSAFGSMAGVGTFGPAWNATPPPPNSTGLGVDKPFNFNDIVVLGNEIVTVRVGADSNVVQCAVHKSLLGRSDVLQALLNSDQGTSLQLPMVKASAFAIYVQWLYSGRLHTKVSTTSIGTVAESGIRHEWVNLVDCYLLGEHINDIFFRDEVIDAMLLWFKEVDAKNQPKNFEAVLDNVTEAYNVTKAGSLLRTLVSDIVAYHFEDPSIQDLRRNDETGGHYPYGFVLDVATKLSSRRQNGMSLEARSPVRLAWGTCAYHCHGEKACYKASKLF